MPDPRHSVSRPQIPITEELLRRLPKTDLHCHLDGSLRITTILELADKQGVKLPATTPEGIAKAVHKGEICESLEDYLTAFDITLAVMQTEESLYRTAYELGVDAADENVRYLEVRYSPVLHTQKGLRLTAAVESVVEGLRAAKRDRGIKSNVLVCGIRNMSPEVSLRLAELAVAYKNKGVVGFDLAGAEHGNPARDHEAAFQLILNNNVNCTVHAGEAYGPASIAQAIHYIGAHRIGHGVRLKEDGDLLNFVNDHRIPIECCPSSNVQTRAVPSMESHPLKFFLDFGVRVTVNTDNRLMTDTTATRELLVAAKTFGFTFDDITSIIINGFKSAFLPFHEKSDVVRRVNAEFAAIASEYAQPQVVRSGAAPQQPASPPTHTARAQ
jgi:adenosine deaminase